MDNQLIAKITELVMEKISQLPQVETKNEGLTQTEIQEWQSLKLMNTSEAFSKQPATFTHNYEVLSAQELQNWESLHREQSFGKAANSTSPSSDLITFKKFT